MRIGGEQMLSWGGANPEQTLHALMQAVAVLLKPSAGDSASLGIGEVCPPLMQIQQSIRLDRMRSTSVAFLQLK